MRTITEWICTEQIEDMPHAGTEFLTEDAYIGMINPRCSFGLYEKFLTRWLVSGCARLDLTVIRDSNGCPKLDGSTNCTKTLK